MAGVKRLSFKGRIQTFVDDVPDDLICPTCKEVLEDPYQTACGHLLCKKCVPKESKENGEDDTLKCLKCPVCDQENETKPTPDRYNQMRIQRLKVKCPNYPCQWSGSFNQITQHINAEDGCTFTRIKCPLGCDEEILRAEVTKHLTLFCHQRMFSCQFCGEKDIYKMIKKHYLNCSKFLVACPNCGPNLRMLRSDLERHLKEECPMQEVKCPFWELGCYVGVKRHSLASHSQANLEKHQRLSLNRIQKLTDIVTSLKPDAEHLQKLNSDEKSWLENDELFPSSPWIIRMDGFSEKMKLGRKWESPPFFSHAAGYKFILWVYANGNREENQGWLSVFSSLISGPNDDFLPWPFIGSVTYTLLNQKRDDDHHTTSIDYAKADKDTNDRPIDNKANVGWGKAKFILRTKLCQATPQCQYLKDDSLCFKVTVNI